MDKLSILSQYCLNFTKILEWFNKKLNAIKILMHKILMNKKFNAITVSIDVPKYQ